MCDPADREELDILIPGHAPLVGQPRKASKTDYRIDLSSMDRRPPDMVRHPETDPADLVTQRANLAMRLS